MRTPALDEIVFCSTHPGVHAYIRELSFTRIDGFVNVSVTKIWRLVPERFSWDQIVADRARLRREYRGPSTPVLAVSPACLYCGHPLIHECAACGLLFCVSRAGEHPCIGCGHQGPGVPLDNPVIPAQAMPGRRDWREWTLDFLDIAERVTLSVIDGVGKAVLTILECFTGF